MESCGSRLCSWCWPCISANTLNASSHDIDQSTTTGALIGFLASSNFQQASILYMNENLTLLRDCWLSSV